MEHLKLLRFECFEPIETAPVKVVREQLRLVNLKQKDQIKLLRLTCYIYMLHVEC